MKKFLTLLLAAAMTLSLAACGSKADDNSGNNSQPASALELLNAVWANYSDDDKFPAAGGDFDEANMTEDAPGNFSVEDGDALDYSLSFPRRGRRQALRRRVPHPHDERQHLHRGRVPCCELFRR